MRYFRFSLVIAMLAIVALCNAQTVSGIDVDGSADDNSRQYRNSNREFVDFSKPSRLLELRAHIFLGQSGITQNYINCFPQITELDVSGGTSYGLGGNVHLLIRDFIALATELNLIVNNYSVAMAVTGDNVSSVSSVFLHNRYLTARIPVFVSCRFNLMRGVKWNVDAGAFFSYGLGGKQRQSLYDSRVNELGQLVMNVERTKIDYYNSGTPFINGSKRSDFGLHFATGLSFGRHIFANVVGELGLKNVSATKGNINPNIHNFNVSAQVGYRF